MTFHDALGLLTLVGFLVAGIGALVCVVLWLVERYWLPPEGTLRWIDGEGTVPEPRWPFGPQMPSYASDAEALEADWKAVGVDCARGGGE